MADLSPLIERSKRGDAKAFDQLMRQTARWVYARLVLAVHDRDRAEDLTQETFLRAWRAIQQIENPQTFHAWLATIARSVVLDDRKNAERQKRGAPRSLEREPADDTSLPIEQIERHEEQSRALDALNQLPEQYRDVLAMRYLTGSDHETICRQMGLSDGALRGLLGRGLKLLRERLSGCEVKS